MPEDHFPDFSGKLVNLYLISKASYSYLIQEATFEMQAGRLFLVGRASEEYDDEIWSRGKYVAIAWNQVEQYILFDSAEDYRAERQRWKLAKAARDNEKPSNRNQHRSVGHWIMSPWYRKRK